jgi:hypothetical protein
MLAYLRLGGPPVDEQRHASTAIARIQDSVSQAPIENCVLRHGCMGRTDPSGDVSSWKSVGLGFRVKGLSDYGLRPSNRVRQTAVCGLLNARGHADSNKGHQQRLWRRHCRK